MEVVDGAWGVLGGCLRVGVVWWSCVVGWRFVWWSWLCDWLIGGVGCVVG